jgi:hypothetical protein
MATVYIEEFSAIGQQLPTDGRQASLPQCARQPSVAAQTRSASGSTAQSSAFNVATRFVRVHTDAIISYKFGANPTAATTDPRMAADTTEYFAVNPGDKLAVITNT